MLIRTKTGKLIEIKLSDYTTDMDYYKFILTLI